MSCRSVSHFCVCKRFQQGADAHESSSCLDRSGEAMAQVCPLRHPVQLLDTISFRCFWCFPRYQLRLLRCRCRRGSCAQLCCLLCAFLLAARALVPQAALLYTSTSGQRRVRCHTLGLPVTGLLPNIFRSTGENGDSHCLWGVRVDAVLGVGVFCPSKSKFVSFPDTCRVLIGTRGAPAL